MAAPNGNNLGATSKRRWAAQMVVWVAVILLKFSVASVREGTEDPKYVELACTSWRCLPYLPRSWHEETIELLYLAARLYPSYSTYSYYIGRSVSSSYALFSSSAQQDVFQGSRQGSREISFLALTQGTLPWWCARQG